MPKQTGGVSSRRLGSMSGGGDGGIIIIIMHVYDLNYERILSTKAM